MKYLSTVLKLGIVNVIRVFLYRMSLYNPYSKIRRITFQNISGKFYSFISCERRDNNGFSGIQYFGWMRHDNISEVPNWFLNPFSKEESTNNDDVAWYTVDDFNQNIGDIKTVWELSRFDWVVDLANQQSKPAIDQLNSWLNNWCENNQFYKGINWKCGQEASIRVLHLLMAVIILKQESKPEQNLLDLIEAHLVRIFPTKNYAIAQDNNHGTSEGAALYCGGSFLLINGRRLGMKYCKVGQKILENRAQRLILSDGSFSQYSTNYHRLMLDTISFTEIWRRKNNLPPFQKRFYNKISLATYWLLMIVDPVTGYAPNIGGNDGAKLFKIKDEDYRDYRSSVQCAVNLFLHMAAYEDIGSSNSVIEMFNLKYRLSSVRFPESSLYDAGGYAFFKRSNSWGLLKYPMYQFRPSHADAFHFDFWLNGKNVLCDGGTYSYNTDKELYEYFSGTASHNTVQFDNRDQMPRYSRFLFGEWLKAKNIVFKKENNLEIFSAHYRDFRDCRHKRTVIWQNNEIQIIDEVSGFIDNAVLRWRFDNTTVDFINNYVLGSGFTLSVFSNKKIDRLEIVQGFKSNYYMKKENIKVLEAVTKVPCKFTTLIKWN